MTILLRMAVGMVFQAIAFLLRGIFFLCVAIVRPFDLLADLLQRFAFWLAVDKDVLAMVLKHKVNKDE